MESLLAKYRNSLVRHPSWRVYKALKDISQELENIKSKNIFDPEELENLSPTTFGLKDGIEVYLPYADNDDLTNEIIAAIIDPDYTDHGKFGIVECMAIFCDIENRQLLEGMLMEGILPTDVALELNLSQSVVQTYSAAFFDTTVWRSDSDKIAYLKVGTIGKDAEIKAMIAKSGIDYVASLVYHKPQKVRMEKALADMFGREYNYVIQNIGTYTEEGQQDPQKWAKNMIEIFRELKNASRGDGGIRELSIALSTQPPPAIGISDLNKIDKNKEVK